MATYLQTELWYRSAASSQYQPGSAFVHRVFPPSRTSACLNMTAETGARKPSQCSVTFALCSTLKWGEKKIAQGTFLQGDAGGVNMAFQ